MQLVNLRSQEVGDLPMERWGAWRKTAEDLRAVAAQIRDVRAFLRRMFLVAAYIADELATLRRYWFLLWVIRELQLVTHARAVELARAHFPDLLRGEIPGVRVTLAGKSVHGQQ